jgi:serine/threonine-protein kinase
MTAEDQATRGAKEARIETLALLASGGMADIWLAREKGAAGLERIVVIKRLLPHLARDPDIVDMFVSEARFVARLVHPNVVQIHELGEDDEGYYLVMEYVAGCSVRELTGAAAKAELTLPPNVAVCVVEQACRGAHAAHELTSPTGEPLGLVHRDISPHNLMIGPGGDVKLLDFGIAKATEAAEATRTGSLKGKVGYMSPEQCRGARVDRRSDVFALGIVCWELLVGQRLFNRDSEYESMGAIVNGDFELPTAVQSDLPAAFDEVLKKALATNPDERWQTAAEFRKALRLAADENDIRVSRDELGATLAELLGDKLKQRKEALRAASSETPDPDPSVFRRALMQSQPPSHSGSRSLTGSDDIATVIQRKSERPSAPTGSGSRDSVSGLSDPALRDTVQDAPGEATLVDAPSAKGHSEAPPDGHDDDATLVDRQAEDPDSVPPDSERDGAPSSGPKTRPSAEVAAARPLTKLVLAVLALAFGGAIALLVMRPPADTAPQGADANVQPSTQPSAGASALPAPTGPALRFVVAPTVKPEVMTRELAPFIDWLGRKVNRPVELTIADSYQHTGKLVTSGQAHFGLLPPLLYVRTSAATPTIRPLAVRLFDGSRASDGYLLVRDDAKLSKADDLRGRTVCHVDRTSTTGFLLPRIWMRNGGLDPDKDVKKILSGNHLAALRDLAAKKCDAASVYSGAFLSARKEGIPVGRMRVLAVTGRVPQDVLAAAPTVPDDEVKRLRDALIGFEPQRDIQRPRVGEVLGISGFAAFDPAEFDTIRKAAEQEGIVPKADAGAAAP